MDTLCGQSRLTGEGLPHWGSLRGSLRRLPSHSLCPLLRVSEKTLRSGQARANEGAHQRKGVCIQVKGSVYMRQRECVYERKGVYYTLKQGPKIGG